MSGSRPRRRRPLVRALLFVAATVLLVEETLWRWGSAQLRRLGRWLVFAALERFIARQPPYRALCLFVLPLCVVLPMKEIAIRAVLDGEVWLGFGMFLLDKLVATALYARLYQLTEPAITQIGWVRRGRDAFLRLRRRLYGWLTQQSAYRQARAFLHRLRRRGGAFRRLREALRRRRRRQSSLSSSASKSAASNTSSGQS